MAGVVSWLGSLLSGEVVRAGFLIVCEGRETSEGEFLFKLVELGDRGTDVGVTLVEDVPLVLGSSRGGNGQVGLQKSKVEVVSVR